MRPDPPAPNHPHADEPLGIYVHVPFCTRLCSYCDFYKLQGDGQLQDRYLDALRADLRDAALSPWLRGRPADSVYLGGGTPTALGVRVADVLGAVRDVFDVAPDAEVTVEANPEDVEGALLDVLGSAGVSRLSLGLQSLDAGELELLGRLHDPSRALHALELALAAPFRSVSVDLILGLPGQAEAKGRETLAAVAALAPPHVSAYLLELDKDTPVSRAIRAGTLPEPDDEVSAALYHAVGTLLGPAGLRRYEISNLCRPGHEGRHNLKYWSDRPYLGFGPSAASYLGGWRFTRKAGLGAYLEAPSAPVASAAFTREELGPADALRDAVMLGLRRTEGTSLAELEARHGPDPALRAEWEALLAEGLLEEREGRGAIPEEHLPVANFVFARLVSEAPSPDM